MSKTTRSGLAGRLKAMPGHNRLLRQMPAGRSPVADLLSLEVDVLFFDTTCTYFETVDDEPRRLTATPTTTVSQRS